MAESLLIYTEGDRFGTMGRTGRPRIWGVDLTGEPVEDHPPPRVVEPDHGRRHTDALPEVVDPDALAGDLHDFAGVLAAEQQPERAHLDEVARSARSLAARLRALAVQVTSLGCVDHRPVQHRDARPPWCDVCRRTADGTHFEQLRQAPGVGRRG